MAIFRGMSVERTVDLAHLAWGFGVKLVEVPIQDGQGREAFEAIMDEAASHQKIAGAGTVITAEQVRFAYAQGAAFTVAPGLSSEVVKESQRLGLPHLPGVATASEIQQAIKLGCPWVKAFPASVLGVDWFRAMTQGPFPAVNLVATGGMNAQNAAEYLKAGASCIAIGSAFERPEQLELLKPLL